MSRSWGFVIVWSLVLWHGIALVPGAEAKRQVWTQSGFHDFVQGRFGDGGANAYVAANGSIQLINRFDLNDDGFLDLVFCNTHAQVEKLDAAIHWGNGKDFDSLRKTELPNEGALWTVVADVNLDGALDAVVPNYTNGTWSEMDSAVYYGEPATPVGTGSAPARESGKAIARQFPRGKLRALRGASWRAGPFVRKVMLPTRAAQNAAVSDLNRDGWPDLVFAMSAGFWEYRGGAALENPSRIFWGAKEGFARDRFLDLDAAGASDVAVADLNRDGWPDLAFANREQAGRFAVDSFIYWGSSGGFSPQRRAELPTRQANAVTLADVDGDDDTDAIFANGEGPMSFVYLNERGAFSRQRRVELPTSDARDCAAADLNGDGFTDLFFTNHQTAGNPLTTSVIYWGDARGFSDTRRQELETVGAWGASLADLNRDGRVDLVVSNYKEHTSFDVPSYIYWNSARGYSNALRTSIFTRGAVGNTVADLNGDGQLDLVFNNTMGRARGGVSPSYIYWGDAKGRYSASRRLELPAVEPYDWAAGDLNHDGRTDLVIANMAEVGRRVTESFVYWGHARGFSEARRSALVGQGARGVGLADLDRNGHLDLVFFNAAPANNIFIYWGEADGTVTTRRTELPGSGVGLPTFADLNTDGHLDLVVSGTPQQNAFVWLGDGTRNFPLTRRLEVPDSKNTSSSEVADLNRDGWLDLILTRRGVQPSLIYYGNARGEYSASRRSQLAPIVTQGVTVGHLNRDPWLDLVVPCYSDTGSRATKSRVYFGGPHGFHESRMQLLPTLAGTGSQIADYNRDGYNDLLLVCHRSEGDPNRAGALSDHVTDSYLYWGGREGLRASRRLLIPVRGAHYDCGVDLGHLADRRFRWDYFSTAHQFCKRAGDRIAWRATTPHGSAVEFQVRTAPTRAGLEHASWKGPRGRQTYYTRSGARLVTPAGHEWIQYRAVLVSPNGAVSPTVLEVKLSFQ